ncbi:MAG: YybH family protein [Gemmatimonadaceae bacterium]
MSTDTSERQIRTLIEEWAQAVRDVDMERILANHTDDILMYDVPPPLQSKGIAAYKKTWDLFFTNSRGGPGSFDLSELEITAGDVVGFAHALVNVSGSTARLSMGLKNVGGTWFIAHEHHSYPIE